MYRDLVLKYKLPIFLGLLGVVFILISFIYSFRSDPPQEDFTYITQEATESSSLVSQIVVNIEGAVVKPGVYELNRNSRVIDLVDRAGGFAPEADTVWVSKKINKAQVLQDGDKLYIPFQGEQVDAKFGGGENSSVANYININTADSPALQSLPGIGEKTAQKIIDNRPYTSIEDLKGKQVVGQVTFEKIRKLISTL